MMYSNSIEITEIEKSLETIAEQLAVLQEKVGEEQLARKTRRTIERALAAIRQVIIMVGCVCLNWMDD